MSLVDYASSDDDDVVPVDPVGENDKAQPQIQNRNHVHEKPESASALPAPDFGKLPDASELLNSSEFSYNALSGSDHSSRVAAAMAQSASSSRKRNPVGLDSSLPRGKVPKGTLTHSKSVPDTGGGILVPPQLRGRSNVVTEDINKLFVKKHAEPSSK
ncbi:uncharacterized protein LOC133829812 isoform X2 [Humulus lupulus]|uniref:uncharacterized protein LOC133829812 isoform X2 n=1 Tax=Humulus lupulus TaxID=3486 RepID=UPI002B4162D5|nr:uncharacterized protein LOC133829812 isoform X2 [Humulus lupulus]